MPKNQSRPVNLEMSARGRAVQVDDPDWTYQLYTLASAVLDAAYAGELSPDWRQRLQIGGESRLACLVGVMPVCSDGAWEPYAAGGRWDLALDAWWVEYLGLVDHYYQVVHPGGCCEREYLATRDRINRRHRMVRNQMRPPPHYWSSAIDERDRIVAASHPG